MYIWRSQFCGMCCHVIWQTATKIPIFSLYPRYFSSLWRLRQQFHLQQWYLYTKLHGVTSHDVILMSLESPLNDPCDGFLSFSIQLQWSQVSNLSDEFLTLKVFLTFDSNLVLSKNEWAFWLYTWFWSWNCPCDTDFLSGYDLQW